MTEIISLPKNIETGIEAVVDAAQVVAIAVGARQVASTDKILRSTLFDLRRDIHLALSQAKELTKQLAAERADRSAETTEFNNGFNAYGEGVSIDAEPTDTKYDVWKAGWVWGQYCANTAKTHPGGEAK